MLIGCTSNTIVTVISSNFIQKMVNCAKEAIILMFVIINMNMTTVWSFIRIMSTAISGSLSTTIGRSLQAARPTLSGLGPTDLSRFETEAPRVNLSLILSSHHSSPSTTWSWHSSLIQVKELFSRARANNINMVLKSSSLLETLTTQSQSSSTIRAIFIQRRVHARSLTDTNTSIATSNSSQITRNMATKSSRSTRTVRFHLILIPLGSLALMKQWKEWSL